MRVSIATIAALLFLNAGTLTAESIVPPPRYFPLDPGNHWVYTEEGRPEGIAREVTVLNPLGDLARVEFGNEVFSIFDAQTELDIELPGEGLVPYYRFEEESFVHRDFVGCDDARKMTIISRNDVVKTPAGVFLNCLRIEYTEGGLCSDAGTEVEWWEPEVGKVKWVEDSFGGPRTYVLSVFEKTDVPVYFRRGEVDANGVLDLTDAISVLGWLFLGEEEPDCLDAADVNDDGVVDLSDPVNGLNYLFLAGEPPPAPGPSRCGKDTTGDALPACRQSDCKDEEVPLPQ